jgi:hypothetical protein
MEEVKAAEATQPAPETQETPETLRAALEATRAELETTRQERDSLNKVVSKAQSRTKAEASLIEKYAKQTEAKITYLASLIDKSQGVEPEPETAVRGLQKFKEPEEKPAQAEETFSPEVKLAADIALGICTEHGWAETSPQYRKAVALGPAEGLKYLYKEATAAAAKTAVDKAELARKANIKDGGGAAVGGGPSAAAQDDKEFTRRFNAGELNSPADFKRAKEILAKQR